MSNATTATAPSASPPAPMGCPSILRLLVSHWPVDHWFFSFISGSNSLRTSVTCAPWSSNARVLIPLTTTGTLYVGPLIARGSSCDPVTVRIHGFVSSFSSGVSLALIRLVASCLFGSGHNLAKCPFFLQLKHFTALRLISPFVPLEDLAPPVSGLFGFGTGSTARPSWVELFSHGVFALGLPSDLDGSSLVLLLLPASASVEVPVLIHQ